MRYQFEQWELDWDNRELRLNGATVHVEPKVLQLLRILLDRPGRLVTKEELTSQLWSNSVVGQDALTRLVKELRRVILDNAAEPQLLLTRRGHGYVFAGQVTCDGNAGSIPAGDKRVQPPATIDANADANADGNARGEATAPDQEEMQSAFCIQWLIPCRRITPLNRTRATVLGRSLTCDEVLDGVGVSREHAQCSYQGPIAILRDMGSRNGTYVNGRPVIEAPLTANDVVRIGSWLGVVVRTPAPRQSRFGFIARDFYGGHELRQLLTLARTAPTTGELVNIVGEQGCGKSTLSSAIHEKIHAQGALGRVHCRESIRGNEGNPHSTSLPFDGALSNNELWTSDHFRTVVFDDIDKLDPIRMQSLVALATQIGTIEKTCPLIITTSHVSISKLATTEQLGGTEILRLKGLELAISPLRSRRSEILDLGKVFFDHFRTNSSLILSSRAAECLLLHSWPMNVLELKRTMQQLSFQSGSDESLDEHHLPSEMAEALLR